jgi:hypothetical protein
MLAKVAEKIIIILILLLSVASKVTDAGPIVAGSSVALCYSACNAGYVTCMAAAGLSAGMIGPFAFVAGIACSATQGACMSACVDVGLALTVAPTP